MDLIDSLQCICYATLFTVFKFLVSSYFCIKKKFKLSTITLFSFLLNFGISSLLCIFVKHDIIAVRIILFFGAVSFIFSAINILFTFFFKFFRKRFPSFGYTLLFFLLVEVFNIGILLLWHLYSRWEPEENFFTYYNCGFVVLFLSLLIWHFFEMKNKKRKSTQLQGNNTEKS